jgi:hypothetical protein
MARLTRSTRRPLTLMETKSAPSADFGDRESQLVLAAAARAVAHELGREAAREYFAELVRKQEGS